MFHVNLPGVFLALIFKIGYRLWTCFPEMIGNWKIGVDVFTFQIKAILEISWNHDCWRKGYCKSTEKKGQVRFLDTCLLISGFTFLRHFLKSSKRSIIMHYPIWRFDFLWFFYFFSQKHTCPRTLPPPRTELSSNDLFLSFGKRIPTT